MRRLLSSLGLCGHRLRFWLWIRPWHLYRRLLWRPGMGRLGMGIAMVRMLIFRNAVFFSHFGFGGMDLARAESGRITPASARGRLFDRRIESPLWRGLDGERQILVCIFTIRFATDRRGQAGGWNRFGQGGQCIRASSAYAGGNAYRGNSTYGGANRGASTYRSSPSYAGGGAYRASPSYRGSYGGATAADIVPHRRPALMAADIAGRAVASTAAVVASTAAAVVSTAAVARTVAAAFTVAAAATAVAAGMAEAIGRT